METMLSESRPQNSKNTTITGKTNEVAIAALLRYTGGGLVRQLCVQKHQIFRQWYKEESCVG